MHPIHSTAAHFPPAAYYLPPFYGMPPPFGTGGYPAYPSQPQLQPGRVEPQPQQPTAIAQVASQVSLSQATTSRVKPNEEPLSGGKLSVYQYT